jgi:DNA-directed RNA polymerase omega subunit
MTNKSNSRSSEVDIEKCVEVSGGNKFNLVLMAAQRARQIKHQNQGSQKHEHLHSNITALLEIQEGKHVSEMFKKAV